MEDSVTRPRPTLPDGVICPAEAAAACEPCNRDSDAAPVPANAADAASPPRLVYLAPKSGSSTGGTSVTILGNFFINVWEVLFGDVPATQFEVVSPNRINAIAPPHPPGDVHVRVSALAGYSEAEKGDLFTYVTLPVVTDLQPGRGPRRGGTLIVVHGDNFVAGQSKVHFGSGLGREVKVLSERMLIVKSPSAEAASVPLVVSTPAGDSAGVPFVYEPPAAAHQAPEDTSQAYVQ